MWNYYLCFDTAEHLDFADQAKTTAHGANPMYALWSSHKTKQKKHAHVRCMRMDAHAPRQTHSHYETPVGTVEQNNASHIHTTPCKVTQRSATNLARCSVLTCTHVQAHV